MLSDLFIRLRAIFRRSAVERELDDELRFHFDRQVEKHVAAGETREAALRRTRLEFGGLDQVKETAAGRAGWISSTPGSRICATASACSPSTRRSPPSRCSPWRSASAPTPRSFRWSTAFS